jgi:hypothetical protein
MSRKRTAPTDFQQIESERLTAAVLGAAPKLVAANFSVTPRGYILNQILSTSRGKSGILVNVHSISPQR